MGNSRNFFYKTLSVLTVLLAVILCGCGSTSTVEETTLPQNGETTLWVVTERTDRYGMNDQAQKLATQFEKTHKNVSIRLDILPEDGEEREMYIEQLRTEIMAGKGPDIYLFPVTSYRSTEQLFQDVNQCMYNGIFCDISEFYEADTELNTEGLVTAVMDSENHRGNIHRRRSQTGYSTLRRGRTNCIYRISSGADHGWRRSGCLFVPYK